MSFPVEVKRRALVACARHCCICHQFVGLKIELHHIKQISEGGEDTFENCIPLCFNCHGDMRSYDHKHPKGTKYNEAELIRHRDNWYARAHNVPVIDYSSQSANSDREILAEVKRILPWGGAIGFVRENNFAGFAFRRSRLDQLTAFSMRCGDPAFEFIDSELEALRAELEASIQVFDNLLATNTFSLDHNAELSTIPPEWEMTQSKRFWKVVNDIHDAVKRLVEAYDSLLRAGRRKLGA